MNPNDAERRAFWTRQMEDAYAFMQTVERHPVAECGEPLMSLVNAVDNARVFVHFSQKPHGGGLPRIFRLRAGLIAGFVAAAREMNDRGWQMRVEDGYRTRTMQKLLALQPYTLDVVIERVLWELDGQPFTPEFLARRLSVLIAASAKIGTHMSGSAIDISVIDAVTGQEVDRGGPYLELSELTPMRTPFVTAAQQANRDAITAIMTRHGFMAYPWEFWHYNSGDVHVEVLNGSAAPGRYGPVEVDAATGAVTPIENPTALLNPPDELAQRVAEALARRQPAA